MGAGYARLVNYPGVGCADLLVDDPSQHRVGKAPRVGEESPQTPVQVAKRKRTKSPAQLKKQAASQQERRKKMASALEEAESEVTSLKSPLRDCQKALEISRVQAVEREARLETAQQLKHWPKRNVALGMHETAVCCQDCEFFETHFENMSHCINHVLCDESEGLFERDEFEPSRGDGGNMRGVNRHVWYCADHSHYHTDPRCAQYWDAVRYLESQLPGHKLRDKTYDPRLKIGDQSRYILDSGDYKVPFSRTDHFCDDRDVRRL